MAGFLHTLLVKFTPTQAYPTKVSFPSELHDPCADLSFDTLRQYIAEQFPDLRTQMLKMQYFSQEIRSYMAVDPSQTVTESMAPRGVIELLIHSESRYSLTRI